MRAILATLAMAAMVAAGCADEEAAPTTATIPPPTSSPATTTTTTALGTTTAATTSPRSASTSTSSSISSSTSLPCPQTGGFGPVSRDFPYGMSSLVGSDIRTGAHRCFERVVIELEGTGEIPGYRVEFVSDPVHLSPSDETVDIAGAATLLIAMASWMTTMEGQGYQGSHQIQPSNVAHILELRLIENFEGMHQWAVGLDKRYPFTVTTLAAPPRLVVDIHVG